MCCAVGVAEFCKKRMSVFLAFGEGWEKGGGKEEGIIKVSMARDPQ